MPKFNERLRYAMTLRNINQADLCKKTNIPKSAMSQYINGSFKPKDKRTFILAEALNVSEAWLMGFDVPMQERVLTPPDISTNNVTFAVIGEVAAGFDKVAIEEWTGDKINIPVDFLKGRKQEDYFVLRVKGDSMYPDYKEGDKILVLKQTALDYSGQIAVVIYGDDYGTIKKVEQRPKGVALVPINPQYPTEEAKGEDIEKIHILGIPKLLIREIEE